MLVTLHIDHSLFTLPCSLELSSDQYLCFSWDSQLLSLSQSLPDAGGSVHVLPEVAPEPDASSWLALYRERGDAGSLIAEMEEATPTVYRDKSSNNGHIKIRGWGSKRWENLDRPHPL